MQRESTQSSNPEAKRKREASCAARAALIGLELHRVPGGGFGFVHSAFGPRDGFLCAVRDLAAAERRLDGFERDYGEAVALIQRARGGER